MDPEVRGHDLIRVDHRRQQHHLAVSADRTQVASRAQREPGERHPVRGSQGLAEDAKWRGPLPVRHHVVTGLEVDRVDSRNVDELLHVDDAAALRGQLGDFLAAHAHVLTRRDLVSLANFPVRDLGRRWRRLEETRRWCRGLESWCALEVDCVAPVGFGGEIGLGDPHVANPATRAIELVEADGLLVNRGVETDRDDDQTEGQ